MFGVALGVSAVVIITGIIVSACLALRVARAEIETF